MVDPSIGRVWRPVLRLVAPGDVGVVMEHILGSEELTALSVGRRRDAELGQHDGRLVQLRESRWRLPRHPLGWEGRTLESTFTLRCSLSLHS